MGASGTDNFCLRWNDFADNVSGAFKELRAESDFFDVTLACSDSGSRTLQAHKVILSACSNFFKSTFRQQSNANKHPNPYIYLRGVTYTDLTSILDFIYNGEVNVAQEDLNSFLAVAEELQIKGLTNRDNASNNEPSNTSTPSNSTPAGKKSSNSARKTVASSATNSEPAVKKIRRSSPAPTPQIQNIAEPVAEVKEMVNIKDDPEVALASTSAVNPEVEQGQGGEYAGEEYDESYDGYYEDDGTELGDGSQGNDGTKALVKSSSYPVVTSVTTLSRKSSVASSPTGSPGNRNQASNQERYAHLIKLEDGKVRCTLCNSIYSCLVSARAHTVRVHEQPDYFECCFCKRIFRTKLNFRSHLNLSHGVKGSNLVASYGRLVDPNEFTNAENNSAHEFLDPSQLVEPDMVIADHVD